MIPTNSQLKFNFLSTIANSRFSNAKLPEKEVPEQEQFAQEETPTTAAANFRARSRARRDGFVSSEQVKQTVTEAVSHSLSVKPAAKDIDWLTRIALGVLGTGVISAGAIAIPFFSKKAPSPQVATTVAKVVESTAKQAIETAERIIPEIVVNATRQPYHPRTQSSGKTKGGNLINKVEGLINQASEWVEGINPFNKQKQTVAPVSGGYTNTNAPPVIPTPASISVTNTVLKVSATASEVVKSGGQQAIATAKQIVHEIGATATSQASNAQVMAKSWFKQASEWVAKINPVNKQKSPITSGGRTPIISTTGKTVIPPSSASVHIAPSSSGVPTPVASSMPSTLPVPVPAPLPVPVVAPIVTHHASVPISSATPLPNATPSFDFSQIPVAIKCKKGSPNYPAYALYRDSQKPNAQELASAISTKVDDFMLKTEPALASRHLFEFNTFLNDLMNKKITVSTGKTYYVPLFGDTLETRTLKTDNLQTLPVMTQLLSDTKRLLQMPTSITGAELQRAHLAAKIELYTATINAYLNNGRKPANWDALIKPTKLENLRDGVDGSILTTLDNILQAGNNGKEVRKKDLANILDDFRDSLQGVVGKEQNIYRDYFKSDYDEITKKTTYKRHISTKNGDIILPWYRLH